MTQPKTNQNGLTALGPTLRYRVDPGDVTPEKAARRMGLTLSEFTVHLPKLLSRGFPPADVTTGLFDLDAIDAWRRRRHPQLFSDAGVNGARDASEVFAERLEAMKLEKPRRDSPRG